MRGAVGAKSPGRCGGHGCAGSVSAPRGVRPRRSDGKSRNNGPEPEAGVGCHAVALGRWLYCGAGALHCALMRAVCRAARPTVRPARSSQRLRGEILLETFAFKYSSGSFFHFFLGEKCVRNCMCLAKPAGCWRMHSYKTFHVCEGGSSRRMPQSPRAAPMRPRSAWMMSILSRWSFRARLRSSGQPSAAWVSLDSYRRARGSTCALHSWLLRSCTWHSGLQPSGGGALGDFKHRQPGGTAGRSLRPADAELCRPVRGVARSPL